MNPFVDSQVSNIVECIRLLEAFVTAPLGLYSDIKMLRESLPVPEAKPSGKRVYSRFIADGGYTLRYPDFRAGYATLL